MSILGGYFMIKILCIRAISAMSVLVLLLNVYMGSLPRVNAVNVVSTAEKAVTLKRVDLDPIRTDMFPGDTTTMRILALNDDEKTCMKKADIAKNIKYSSSDNSIVSVDKDGIIKAIKPGIATVKADVTENGVTKSGTSDITVIDSKKIKNFKSRSTIYTPVKIKAARENIKKYDWAAAEAKKAITEADKYVALGNDFLWNIVTAQTLPRAFAVSQEYGSIEMGKAFNDKYGQFGWKTDPVNHPWKVINPENGLLYPSNDFESYYKSGLDEHGIFRPEKADKKYLVNTLYPEKGPKWGVDDGFGYVDEKGHKFTFIAYYLHWGVWYDLNQSFSSPGLIFTALRYLKDAYVYTGDAKYAEAGIILLDRVADVYPEFDTSAYKWTDGFVSLHGYQFQGKVLGSIHEPVMVTQWIYAYDAFFSAMNDPKVIDFLSKKAAKYKLSNSKNTAAAIKRNIEDNILKQVLPSIKRGRYEGNFGMHQNTLAAAAVVLDTMPYTKDMLDFLFATCKIGFYTDGVFEDTDKDNTYYRTLSGGDVARTLVETDMVNRDGMGNEGSPGYNATWVDNIKIIADVLDGYDNYPSADLYKNPKYSKMLTAMASLILIEKYTAHVGDSGSCGNAGILATLPYCVKAFEKYNKPIDAQLAYFLNGNSANGIHLDIFTKDPESISLKINEVIKKVGYLNLPSQNLTDAGFTILRDGINNIRDVGTTYNFPNLKVNDNSSPFTLYTSSSTVQFDNYKADGKISFEFNVLNSDTYEIDLLPYRANSYGIYDISIDGNIIKKGYDFFGSSTNAPQDVLASNVKLSEGKHTITFACSGRNTNNVEAYKLGVRKLILLTNKDLTAKAAISTKTNTLRDIWTYYGINFNHGHKGILSLGINAFGLDLSADTGYPEQTGPYPMRMAWDQNTVCHNTVVVDKSKQLDQVVGQPYHFDSTKLVKLFDIDAPKAYKQTSQYRRTSAMITVDETNSYTVDFFRVKGGNDHYYSFHSYEGEITTNGLHLITQPTGTYAGPNVEYRSDYDGKTNDWGYMGSGFQYLKNVQRDTKPANNFSVQWNIKDLDGKHTLPNDVHLKMTMLGTQNDIAICDGVPPQGSSGNPASLKYFIAHRSGENLNSLFTAVFEPFKGSSYISTVSEAKVLRADGKPVDPDVKAVKVVLKNGRIDYIVNALNKDILYIIDNKFNFKGFFGVYSLKNKKVVHTYLNDGTVLDKHVQTASLNGVVSDFTKDFSKSNQITVTFDKNTSIPKNLIGRFIYVVNDGTRNAAYEIKQIKSIKGNSAIIDIGDITTVRGYIDDNDFSKGYKYDLTKGARFSIPLSTEWQN